MCTLFHLKDFKVGISKRLFVSLTFHGLPCFSSLGILIKLPFGNSFLQIQCADDYDIPHLSGILR